MQFAQPLWLLAGMATCAFLLWRYRQFQTQQRTTLVRFAAARLLDKLTVSVSPGRRKTKQTLFILGVACLFIALARPQAGYEWQETHRKGLELLFAVDTSKSMLAQDVKPDRLSRAKLAVHDLMDKMDGDGVGLVAFAGNAFLQCPMTLDYDAFRESLDALDTKVIPRGGTDIAAAIREAEAVFKTRTASEKILVLITDGEDLGGEAIAAAKEAANNGVKIFTVGVGSTTGELVPVPSENGETGFAKDASGQLVKSHLDESTLKQIAEATGGIYRPLGQQGEGLNAIYDHGLSSFTRHDLSSRQAKVYLEQFQWALLAALFCFVAEMLIGTRRKVREAKVPKAPVKPKPAWAHSPTAALGLALLCATVTTYAALPQAAEQAYRRGDFTKSLEAYAAAAAKEPAKTQLQFNAGSAAYKAGDLARAATAFQNSLHTEEVPIQQGAYFNLGNTQFRLGQKTEKSNPKETLETWEQAVRSYDAALQIEPGDEQAKHNRDLVKRKIEQLKKQEEQKKQQQQDQKNDSKDQKSDPKNQQGGQNGQEPKDQQQQQAKKDDSKDQKSDPKNQQGGQSGQEPKDQQQQQAKKDDSKDQKSDPKNQQGGQSGQEPKDQQQQQAKKDDSKDQKSDPKNQQGGQSDQEPKDQQQQQAKKDDSKDQKSGPKNQQGGQSGQEPKDQQQQQAKKDDSKDQKGDPGNPQDDQNGQQAKDQKQQAKDDSKDRQAGQNGQRPKDQMQQDQAQNAPPDPARSEPLNPTGKKPSKGQAQAANGQQPKPDESASAGGERREPGQMTKEEAQQLLDALKNDERKLPAMSMQGRAAGQSNDSQPPLKDW